MVIRALLLGLIFSVGSVWASNLDMKSAKRDPGVSYKTYKARVHLMASKIPMARTQGKTAMDSAQKFSSATLPAATAWESEAKMVERFKKLRDVRFLVADERPDFMRRSTWLYPDDGCFARAQLANHNLREWNIDSPKKVFVFGDLNVKTNNSPDGEVSWWYHVAPIVEVAGVKYVLDPALDPRQPLRLEEWLAKQNAVPGDLEVAICSSGAYTPFDPCTGKEVAADESEAEGDQKTYFSSEWRRLESLGRNPVEELGEKPPWQ